MIESPDTEQRLNLRMTTKKSQPTTAIEAALSLPAVARYQEDLMEKYPKIMKVIDMMLSDNVANAVRWRQGRERIMAADFEREFDLNEVERRLDKLSEEEFETLTIGDQEKAVSDELLERFLLRVFTLI